MLIFMWAGNTGLWLRLSNWILNFVSSLATMSVQLLYLLLVRLSRHAIRLISVFKHLNGKGFFVIYEDFDQKTK